MISALCRPTELPPSRFTFLNGSLAGSRNTFLTVLFLVALFMALLPLPLWSQGLQEQLERESAADLAREAMVQGDPQRGAIAFFQPQMACVKCHSTGGSANPLDQNQLGPNLSELSSRSPALTDVDLVESVLRTIEVDSKGI